MAGFEQRASGFVVPRAVSDWAVPGNHWHLPTLALTAADREATAPKPDKTRLDQWTPRCAPTRAAVYGLPAVDAR